MNPVAVEDEIRRLLERLEDATLEMAPMAEAAGRAEVAYKVAQAKSYLKAEGPVATREATATVESERELLERRIAESRLMAQRELLTTIRTQVDGLRTIAANMRNLA